jgi:hypothetical protein
MVPVQNPKFFSEAQDSYGDATIVSRLSAAEGVRARGNRQLKNPGSGYCSACSLATKLPFRSARQCQIDQLVRSKCFRAEAFQVAEVTKAKDFGGGSTWPGYICSHDIGVVSNVQKKSRLHLPIMQERSVVTLVRRNKTHPSMLCAVKPDV